MSESGNNDQLQNALTEFLSLFEIKLNVSETDKSESSTSGNYSELVQATQNKLDEFNIKAEQILQKTGMSRDELDTYASNPDNFSPEQWMALQKLREATEELKRRTYKIAGDEGLKKTIEKEKGKQQHRFGKKKDWIPL